MYYVPRNHLSLTGTDGRSAVDTVKIVDINTARYSRTVSMNYTPLESL